MSAQQGNNLGINQLTASNDTVPNRRISDNFSSSRSYAPECKLHIFIFQKEKKKKRKLISNYICFIMNKNAGCFYNPSVDSQLKANLL